MNSLILYCWVLFGSVIAIHAEEIDLDHLAGLYARDFARDCGTKLRWFDLHGKQPHLKEQYPNEHITVRAENIKYGTVARKVDRPGYVFKKTFRNGGSLPIKGILTKVKTVASTFTWSVTESLKVGAEVEIDVGLPGVVSGNVKLSTELNLASTQGKTTTETEKFSVSQIIPVPPKKRVLATMTITETEVEVPWTATMYVTGDEAIWVEEKCKDHWLWFPNVARLAKYSRKLKAGMTPYGYGISFEAKGVFKAVKAVRAVVHTKEYPLKG